MNTTDSTPLKVGIIVKLFGAKYYGQMVDGASTYLHTKGINTIVKSSSIPPEHEFDAARTIEFNAARTLIDENCNGLIVQSDFMNDDMLMEIARLQPNVVFMNRYCAKLKNHCVFVDNHSAGKTAAKYLIKKGHNNIALVTGPTNHQDTLLRTKGFIEQLRQYGICVSPKLILERNFCEDGGYRAIKKLLDTKLDFTAVAFQNDQMAVGAMLYCQENHIRVPEDLSILGFDDQDLARQIAPGLSTIRQPLVDIGAKSGKLIHDIMTTGQPQKPVELKLDLVIRNSVCTLKNHENKVGDRAKLSAREIECLSWIAQGKTSGETALILSISESTVAFHLRKASEKLNTVNRTHAVAKAILDSHLH